MSSFHRKANFFRRTETSAVWNLDKICGRRHLHFSKLPQQVSSGQRVRLHYRRWPKEESLYFTINWIKKNVLFHYMWRVGKVMVINLFKTQGLFYLDITHELVEVVSTCDSLINSTIYFRIFREWIEPKVLYYDRRKDILKWVVEVNTGNENAFDFHANILNFP